MQEERGAVDGTLLLVYDSIAQRGLRRNSQCVRELRLDGIVAVS